MTGTLGGSGVRTKSNNNPVRRVPVTCCATSNNEMTATLYPYRIALLRKA